MSYAVDRSLFGMAHAASGRPESARGTDALALCWRCGVQFDPTLYIEGAPCSDCQLDDPPNEWMRLDERLASYYEARDRHVARLHHRRYSDAEIGRAIGMSRDGVARVRRTLGLPAHVFAGDEKWRDREAVLRGLAEHRRNGPTRKGD